MKRLLVLVTLTCGVSANAADTDKTLVSWVMLKDKQVEAGSVLTVQAGDQFDGIVFAELAEARWMAGSDYFRRTNRQQEVYPREEADANTLVQISDMPVTVVP